MQPFSAGWAKKLPGNAIVIVRRPAIFASVAPRGPSDCFGSQSIFVQKTNIDSGVKGWPWAGVAG
jgi:hypothetical protein